MVSYNPKLGFKKKKNKADTYRQKGSKIALDFRMRSLALRRCGQVLGNHIYTCMPSRYKTRFKDKVFYYCFYQTTTDAYS